MMMVIWWWWWQNMTRYISNVFLQGVSVYISTFSMTAIALDRFLNLKLCLGMMHSMPANHWLFVFAVLWNLIAFVVELDSDLISSSFQRLDFTFPVSCICWIMNRAWQHFQIPIQQWEHQNWLPEFSNLGWFLKLCYFRVWNWWLFLFQCGCIALSCFCNSLPFPRYQWSNCIPSSQAECRGCAWRSQEVSQLYGWNLSFLSLFTWFDEKIDSGWLELLNNYNNYIY